MDPSPEPSSWQNAGVLIGTALAAIVTATLGWLQGRKTQPPADAAPHDQLATIVGATLADKGAVMALASSIEAANVTAMEANKITRDLGADMLDALSDLRQEVAALREEIRRHGDHVADHRRG